ncbi:MAG: FG-GAP-like repeat-containing protein [Patescibacteria group bacterium]
MLNLKSKSSVFLSKLTMSALVFLFIFTSSPGLALAAEEAVSPEAPADTSASAGSTDTSTPTTDTTTPTPAEAPADQASLDGAKADTESQDQGMDTLTEEEDPENSPETKKAAENKFNLETDGSTGALIYTFPLTIPPGRNNLQPDLKLVYNNQNNDNTNIIGYGWSLNIPYIERQPKIGVNNLYDENYFTSSLSGELEDISLTDGHHGTYGSKVENGDFLNYEFNANNYWVVTDKKGTFYRFGYNSGARQDDPNDSSHAFKWMLEEVRDTNNNYIKYEYYKDAGQIYPADIKYTGYNTTDGIFEIDFLRESRNDDLASFKTGFEVTTSYRINEIQAKINGTWVKKYQLDYSSGDNGVRSMLNTITETGQDEQSNTITLPTNDFTYQTKTKSWTEDTNYIIPETFVTNSFRDFGTRILDINGDGLPDIIRSQCLYNGNSYKKVYINQGDGTGWVEDTNYTIPVCFVSSGGYDTGARLADINGDGFVDILYAYRQYDGSIYSKVYLNQNDGTGWEEDTNWSIPVDFCGGGHGSAARLSDVDGDGLVDILSSQLDYYQQIVDHVYINKGDGTGWQEDTNYTIPESFVTYSLHDMGTRIIDVNGDGLPDILRSQQGVSGNPDIRHVYINKGDGTGWAEDTNYTLPENFVTYSGYDFGVRTADINGDGLEDIIRAQDGISGYPDIRHVYINNGDGTGWTEDTNYTIPENFAVTSCFGNGTQIIDINGDDLADIIRAQDGIPGYSIPDIKEVYISNPHNADLLSQITQSRGGQSSVEYKGSPQYLDLSVNLLNPHLQKIIQTVSQIEYDDGLNNTWTESYQYADGLYYFSDYLNRKLAGFGKVTKTDGEGNVTKTYFHQGNDSDSSHGEYSDDVSKIGKVYRTESYDDSDNLYSKTINKWENYDLGNDQDFVKLTQTIASSYDGNTSHKDKAETYTYDNANGNLTEKITWGEVTGSDNGTFTDTGSDKYTTDIDYAATTGSAVIGSPSHETTIDQSSNKIKETKYYYDTLSLGSVGAGNLTKQEMWKSGTSYINAQKTYNSYGLVTEETDPRGKTTDYTYDTYNLYPASVTNALSQTSSYAYDYSSGKPTQVTDPNSRVFQTVYDALDRVKQEKQPDLTTPSTLVVKSEYTYTDNTVPTKVQQANNLDSSTSFDIYTYLDGFGRKIQERKEAEDTNTFSVKDFVYNDLGLIEKESLPYFSSGSSRTTATTDTSLYTNYTYDPLQRVLTAINAVGTTSNTYDDWKLTITDAESNVKDLYKDAYDNLIQVDEHNDSNTYSTYYEWNGLSNLTKITDSQDNVRNFTYDGLGRRLTAEDLHDTSDSYFGAWTYSYDDSGNLTSRLDPKSQTVNWTYDDLNRVLTEDYTGQTGTEITYAYDTGTDGIGRLYTATTPDVVTTYAYNALGGVKTENKNINSADYLTEYEYDRQGNQTLITYPNDIEVKYNYNTAGLLEEVEAKASGDPSYTDLVSDYDYSPLEQVAYQEDANGVKTYNTYDAAELYRLKEKITASVDEGGFEDLYNIAMAGGAGNGSKSYEITNPYEYTNSSSVSLPGITDNPVVQGLGSIVKAALAPLVIQSEPLKMASEESFTSNNPFSAAFDLGNNANTANVVKGLGLIVKAALSPTSVILNGSEESVTTPSAYSAAFDLGNNANATNDIKVEPKLDLWGKPVDYKLPKDKTIYLKYDKEAKPGELPKEAIEFLDKSGSKINSPELKSIYPQEAIDYFNSGPKSITGSLSGAGASLSKNDFHMALTGTMPNPSTNLNSESKWTTENIIYNQGFEDGFNSWTWQNNLDATRQEDCTVSYAGDCSEKAIVNTAGSFWQVQLSQILRLDQDTNYKLRFKAKASTATTFSFDAEENHSPYNLLGLWASNVAIGTDWTTYEYSFTALANDQNAKITFHLGANSATYWFDEIELIPDTFNKIKNPSFENSAAYWGFTSFGGGYGAGTNSIDCGSPVEGSCDDNVDITVTGNYWEVSLSQPTALDSTKTYELSFYARTDSPYAQTPHVCLAQNHSPWTDLTSLVGFTLDNGWQKYEVELTPSATDSNGRLLFYLGDNSDGIYFDDVKLKEIQPTKISDSTPEFSAIYDDADSGDYATDYQIQVIKYDGDWDEPLWDSGQTALTSSVLEGDRTEDISYGGAALPLNGMKYFWRIKLWDDDDNEGSWTNGKDYFVMQGKRIQDLAYTYDNVGNIAQIIDESETNTKKKSVFEYDDLYRLTSATISDSFSDYTQTYAYDSLGNFTNRSGLGNYAYEGNTGTSFANPHAVTTINSAANLDYDNNGNLTNLHLGSFVLIGADYDYNNRIIETLRPNSQTSTYKYDHSGQRIEQNISSGAKVTVYPNKYYEKTTEGETVSETLNIYSHDQLIGTVQASGSSFNLYFVHPDHLNSSSVMTNYDETGSVDQVIDYTPFGGLRFNEQNSSQDIERKFTGHIADDSTTLQYFGARYYQGDVGRFWSEDPVFLDIGNSGSKKVWGESLANPQGLNSYSYVLNNPLRLIDPLGLRPLSEHETAVAMQMQSLWSSGASSGSSGADVFRTAYNTYVNTIQALPEGGDPQNFTITNDAMFKWYDNQMGYTDWSYGAKIKSDYYTSISKNWKCNYFVAETLKDSVGYKNNMHTDWLDITRRPPLATDWVHNNVSGFSSVQTPGMGDVISFDNEDGSYHAGIYFGSNLYISATATAEYQNGNVADGVIIKPIPTGHPINYNRLNH